MSYDDSSRMSSNGRKPMGQRYDNNSNYSPSTNYRYNSGPNSFAGSNQPPRRRNDRFKRESLNHTDKLVRQNDIIISLLREIRDRLPSTQHGSAGAERGFMLNPEQNDDFKADTAEQAGPGQYPAEENVDNSDAA